MFKSFKPDRKELKKLKIKIYENNLLDRNTTKNTERLYAKKQGV